MRLLRSLCVAMAALALAIAFLGETASAEEVVLCNAHESPCLEENVLPEQTVLKGGLTSGGAAILNPKGGFVEFVSCKASTFEAQTKAETSGEATELEAQVQALTLAECKEENGNECTSTPIQLKLQASIGQESAEQKGTLKVYEHGSSGSPAAEFTCIGVTCTYGLKAGEKASLAWSGGSPASITANLQLFEKVPKLLCPTEAAWEAQYQVNEPKPVFVTHR